MVYTPVNMLLLTLIRPIAVSLPFNRNAEKSDYAQYDLFKIYIWQLKLHLFGVDMKDFYLTYNLSLLKVLEQHFASAQPSFFDH